MVQSCRMRKHEWTYYLYLIFMYLSIHTRADKEKRQIFREQLLPALGGKIPEEAFKTERLALNKLNKDGITIEDNHPRVKYSHQKHSSKNEVLKVFVARDNHFKEVDTTYVIRKPIEEGSRQKADNYYKYILNKPQTYPSHSEHHSHSLSNSGEFKSTVTQPLVKPAANEYFQKSYYPSWTFIYDWETYYRLLNDYYRNVAFINSHQIIKDYGQF